MSVIVIGAGFAGAATAWALARRGLGPGLILEREPAVGVHASGRNAGLLKLTEDDPVVRTLAVRTAAHLAARRESAPDLVDPTGGLTVAPAGHEAAIDAVAAALGRNGVVAERLSAETARRRVPFLTHLSPDTFGAALWCAAEGVVDVHALLAMYLREAREGGFALRLDTTVDALCLEAGRVVGVETPTGTLRADLIVDATGAWAGRLGRPARPLPLQPLRRHLYVSAPIDGVTAGLPFVWVEDAAFYFRREGNGLLVSPCDETPVPPGLPSVDPSATALLADKLSRHAPGFGNLSVRRAWACLRTFAPDRRPVIGPDPDLPGLFHVSGLGGFGVMTSAAVGELAATLIAGATPDWIDAAALAPARLGRSDRVVVAP